jgi:histidinol phosphatase-like enzyme
MTTRRINEPPTTPTAVFLDLNETLRPVQAKSPEEYQVIPCTAEAMRLLNAAGYLCLVVTAQSGIAMGVNAERRFYHEHSLWMFGQVGGRGNSRPRTLVIP